MFSSGFIIPQLALILIEWEPSTSKAHHAIKSLLRDRTSPVRKSSPNTGIIVSSKKKSPTPFLKRLQMLDEKIAERENLATPISYDTKRVYT